MAAVSTHIDKALAERMLGGQKKAFDEFFNAYFARLYRFCLVRLGDDEDAIKEVVQRTMVRGIEKLDTYRGEASLFTWLCRLCRNEISTHLKRAQREMSRAAPFDEAEIRSALDAPDSIARFEPETSYRRLQIGRAVRAVLDHLPRHHSDALELKYIQGLTIEEIATRMGVSLEAANSLLARARRSFRDCFCTVVDVDPGQILGDSGG